VKQLARTGPLVAANQLPSRAIQPGQPAPAVSAQHRMDRRWRQTDQRTDPGRASLRRVADCR
jgi:hypothetical protein